jgi:hypothetical protein
MFVNDYYLIKFKEYSFRRKQSITNKEIIEKRTKTSNKNNIYRIENRSN